MPDRTLVASLLLVGEVPAMVEVPVGEEVMAEEVVG
jgi:hypothetical protein